MPVIQIPGVGPTFSTETPKNAAITQRIINARDRFFRAYMNEKGWGDDIDKLSIAQIFEIRKQPGWKDPLRGDE